MLYLMLYTKLLNMAPDQYASVPNDIAAIYKSSCEILKPAANPFDNHAISTHMKSYSKPDKGESIRKDEETSTLTNVDRIHTTLSEPEESLSSGVESFDEDDMYPGDYHDETASDSPDSDGESQSPSEEMVCGTLPINLRRFHI
jgi:hypothetical protein